MPDESPKLNAVGEPEPPLGQPVQPHHPEHARGERQDGAGAAPDRSQRSDAVPPGATNDARRGARQGTGTRDPFEADRGDPADMRSGAAGGSGAEAGGTAGGGGEDPDAEKGGGVRPQD